MPNTLARIYRFPVKGLQGEPLDAVALAAGQGLPHDRRFAIARGDTQLDPAAPHWLPKQWFIMLMRDTALARVACRFDETAGTIELHVPGTAPCVAAFGTAAGRAQIETYINDCLGPRREGRAYWVESGQASFTDVPQNCLSLVNLASVRALEARMGTRARSVALPRQPLCRRRAGVGRVRLGRARDPHRRRRRCGSRRASRAAPQPVSTPRPASAA